MSFSRQFITVVPTNSRVDANGAFAGFDFINKLAYLSSDEYYRELQRTDIPIGFTFNANNEGAWTGVIYSKKVIDSTIQ